MLRRVRQVSSNASIGAADDKEQRSQHGGVKGTEKLHVPDRPASRRTTNKCEREGNTALPIAQLRVSHSETLTKYKRRYVVNLRKMNKPSKSDGLHNQTTKQKSKVHIRTSPPKKSHFDDEEVGNLFAVGGCMKPCKIRQ